MGEKSHREDREGQALANKENIGREEDACTKSCIQTMGSKEAIYFPLLGFNIRFLFQRKRSFAC
jgi:hypothetical protein